MLKSPASESKLSPADLSHKLGLIRRRTRSFASFRYVSLLTLFHKLFRNSGTHLDSQPSPAPVTWKERWAFIEWEKIHEIEPTTIPFKRNVTHQVEDIPSDYPTHSLHDNPHLCKNTSCTRSASSRVSLSRTDKVSVYSPGFWPLTSSIWYRDSSGSELLPL